MAKDMLKKPVTFKCDRELLADIEAFRMQHRYPPTLTGVIEEALREKLDRERGDASKRAARR